MNEWSPGGNYSRPGTPNQTRGSYRSQWDESEKGTKPLIVNIRAVSENRSRSFLQQSTEDLSKSSLSICSRNKKAENGVSDPRFKRVIASGNQNDACMGTEGRSLKPTIAPQDQETTKSKLLVWNSLEYPKIQLCDDSSENRELGYNHEPVPCENQKEAEPPNHDQSQDHLKAVDKLSFSHDIIVKSFSKDTVSDCTVNTRNTSLVSEDLVNEISNDLSRFPSVTRVKKVQNWIQDQRVKLDKKQSVITVIGQTQGQDNLSSALREIDERRKLVKELDKYAVCNKIIETDKGKEISDLVEKINSFATTARVIFTENKQTELNQSSNNSSRNKGNGDKIVNNSQDDFEPTLPTSEPRKRPCIRKKLRKSHLFSDGLVKGRASWFFSRLHYQWIFCLMVILSGALCWYTFLPFQKGTYVSFDLFTPKPKPLTWYEKICLWIWEIFRPSSNYRRTAPWQPY